MGESNPRRPRPSHKVVQIHKTESTDHNLWRERKVDEGNRTRVVPVLACLLTAEPLRLTGIRNVLDSLFAKVV